MTNPVRLVNDALALMSMRDSDFDANSAFGEIVDNSIQAGAKKIAIRFETAGASKKSNYEYVSSIAFGDDGDGMDAATLHRCLQLGYSTRYNDRSGIGRFGVGMTLAAIHECKRVEVFSRRKGGNWKWTYTDIDEITKDPERAAIPEPVDAKPPAELLGLAGKESGTIVIWKTYDRQPESADKMRLRMHEWMGRTFRHFIWDGLEIVIDGATVKVVDPLYMRWEKTRFPDDPPGEEFHHMEIEWPVPDELKKAYGKDHSIIRIRMSLSHESNWPHQGAGNRKEARDRFFDDNEGVSILRNNREVFYDIVPHWPGGADWFKDKDRWWGCEIRFDGVLDRAFHVKNIKRGAVPNAELKKAIYDAIAPTVKTCRERIDAQWLKAKKKEAIPKDKGVPVTGHEDAEQAAGKTPTDTSALDAGKNPTVEAEKLVEMLKAGDDAVAKAAWAHRFSTQPYTILDDRWKGPQFLEVNHLGGKDVLRYNREHPFFVEVYQLLESVDNGTATVTETRRLKALLDLLLIAYSKAEAKFDAQMQFSAEDFVEQLRLNWGLYLQNYVRTWLREATSADN